MPPLPGRAPARGGRRSGRPHRERGAQRETRRHIIAWDWSWNFHEADPQAEFIAALPPTVR
jgi:hypothetical protein